MIHKKESRYLNPLFNKLKEPDLPEPELKLKFDTGVDMTGKETTRKLSTPFQSVV